MKYKVGDKVKIKSLDWYNKNRNELGDVMISNKYGNFCFTSEDSKLCGKIVTIEDIDKSSHGYILAEDFRKYYFS